MFAVAVMLGCLFLYVGGGALLVETGRVTLPYPFLTLSSDPVLVFMISGVGLFSSVASVVVLVYAGTVVTPVKETLVLTVLSGVGAGSGFAAWYWSFRQFLRIVC